MSILPIPAVDLIDGKCVRLSQGDYERCTVYDASPVDQVKRYVDHGLRRIHVVDLDGAKASEPQNLRVLEQMASVNGAEIEWGGGIKTEQALRDSFNSGASFAVIGSLAARQPELMAAWLEKWGPEKVVLGADVRGRKVAVSGWTEEAPLTISALIEQLLPAGLSQVIATQISHDGMFTGGDRELYAELLEVFPSVVLTASGGIGSVADIESLELLGVPRVIVGKALYEGRITLKELESYVG